MQPFGIVAALAGVLACSSPQQGAPGPGPVGDPTLESTPAEGEAPVAQERPDTDSFEAQPPPPPPPRPPGGLPIEMETLLDAHNRARATHCAAPLTWSPKLAASALAWAEALRDRGCAFEHSRTKYGENLAGGTAGSLDAEGVTAMWYDEVKLYNFGKPGFAMATGHFTQVVWKATTQLGCGRATCKTGMELWVCQYDPPGNMQGAYPQNVVAAGCN